MVSQYYLCAGLAAALALASPVTASAAESPAGEVTRFYGERGGPLWLQSPDATRTLLDALRSSPLDGFAEGPEFAAMIETMLGQARDGRGRAAKDAELMMSNAYVLYVQALQRGGDAGMVFADPSLRPRAQSAASILAEAGRAPDLAAHIRKTVEVNPIYAALRTGAAADLQLLGQPSRALRASLDRAKLLPASGRYVLVDLASQQLWMMENGRAVDRMKVVVGKTDMKTPLMAGTLRQVTVNPYWNVPVDLAAKNIAPNVLRHGVSWFTGRGYEVLSGWQANATVLDPATVDWQAVADGRQEARVRQTPSATNMMGAMKFEFPNELGIYLHDTPERGLFNAAQRTFSSGCVRLEDAARLGRWLLNGREVPTSSEPERQVPLAAGVPVFLTYLTVRPEPGGKLAHAPDIYGLDSENPRLATAN